MRFSEIFTIVTLLTFHPAIKLKLFGKATSFVMFLWEQGFITVDLLQDNPDVGLTEKSFDEESVAMLDDIYKSVLNEIKRILSQR